MAAAQPFYQDPNRPMPAVGQNQGQPDPMYHSEFATQYGDSPHPVFDGPSMPRDAALQARSLAKVEARCDEIHEMTRRLVGHAKSVEQHHIPSELKAELEKIGEGLAHRNRLESLEEKVEKVADWVQQVAKKVNDLYKMNELNMPRRS